MTDQTPDFDSMSPEELMAWMESLAKRQGADEGFTTAADMAVPEVDPSSVQVDEPGYIPYGMDAATWKVKQEAEAQRKAERRAVAASAPPPAAPPPPAPTPVAAPVPVAPAASAPEPAAAGGQPDFDSMSPEQLMAWMESLAKRQGVDAEQLTTSADMVVAEVDASTVQLDEPGYIPYGMDPEKWAVKQAEEARRKEERRAAASAAPQPTPAAPPVPAPRPASPPPVAAAPPPPAAQPELDLFSMDEIVEDESTRMAPAEENPLSWLESLAADGGSGTGLPELDLSGLDQPLVPDLSAVGGGQDDPMAWLESLSQGQNAIPGLEQFSLDEVAQPPAPASRPPAASVPAAPASDNPLEWLESLARRQGADSEELTTAASLDIPTPDAHLVNKGPGYTEYTFESDHAGDDTDALSFLETVDEDVDVFDVDTFGDDTEDTSDWLTALASGDVPEMPAAAAKTEDIQSALAQGAEIPPDAMKDWMDQMLEQGAARSDVADYVDEDEDEQIVPAKLPDWLIEQVGAPPETSATPSNLPSTSPLVNEIVEPPAVDMPDWLREDIAGGDSAEMEDIFAFEDEPLPSAPPVAAPPAAAPRKIQTGELQMDTSDPWVEAFEVERKLGDESVPSWYAKKLASLGQEVPEELVVSVETGGDSSVILMSADLPDESELTPAVQLAVPDWLDVNVAAPAAPIRRAAAPAPVQEEPEEPISASVPDWLRDQMPAEQADVFSADLFLETEVEDIALEEPSGSELPEWLREAGLGTEDEIEIPAWLTETLETNETPAVAAAPPSAPATPTPAPAPIPAPAAVSPAPIVAAAANINVGEMLNEARSTFQAGQFDESVQAYEAVIRANAGLDAVVEDLSGYIKNDAHKSNPALYRVLGDGLMRQGKLQQALDTYRKALNLL